MFDWLREWRENRAAERDASLEIRARGMLAGVALEKGPDSWEWKGLASMLATEAREGRTFR